MTNPGNRERIRFMADSGMFPLWSDRGGYHHMGAREDLGLSEQLVEDLRTWAIEEEMVLPPPDGRDGWRRRGEDLYRRVCEELDPDEYDVVYIPD